MSVEEKIDSNIYSKMDKKIDSFRCGYKTWNEIKKELVESVKKCIFTFKTVFSKKTTEEMDEFKREIEIPINKDIVLSFVLSKDKYRTMWKETQLQGIQTLLNSNDMEHNFSIQETKEVSVSMKTIMPFVRSKKEEMKQISDLFSESAKRGGNVVIR
jgi:hypothetical protein